MCLNNFKGSKVWFTACSLFKLRAHTIGTSHTVFISTTSIKCIAHSFISVEILWIYLQQLKNVPEYTMRACFIFLWICSADQHVIKGIYSIHSAQKYRYLFVVEIFNFTHSVVARVLFPYICIFRAIYKLTRYERNHYEKTKCIYRVHR